MSAPTLPDELREQLLAAYVEEAGERLAVVGRDLVALEQGTAEVQPIVLDRLRREVHTIKGAARSAGRNEDVVIAHTLESVLVRVDEGEVGAIAEALALVGVLERGLAPDESADAAPAEPARRAGPAPAIVTLPTAAVAPPSTEDAAGGADGSAAPDGGPPAPTPPAGEVARHETVRVTAAKLDDLMTGVGELAEVTVLLEEAGAALRSLTRASAPPRREALEDVERRVADGLRSLGRTTNVLRDRVHTTRLQPADTVLGILPRVARDLARQRGRSVQVILTGGETEVDRGVLDALGPALRHLVRNAVEHGVEDEATRVHSGKPPTGIIRVEASRLAGDLHLVVSDDGAGIDPDAVRRAAAPYVPGPLPVVDDEAIRLVLLPGVTTAAHLTDSSGRGVGLDVVRVAVEALGGTIGIESRPGAGTSFALAVPVTIAALRCLVVTSGPWACAVPALACEGAAALPATRVGWRAGEPVAEVNGRVLPVRSLSSILEGRPTTVPEHWTALVVGAEHRSVAVLVDELLAIEDLVVEHLPWPLPRIPGVAGVAVRPSGSAMIVLDPSSITRSAGAAPVERLVPQPDAPPEEVTPPVILIAEDSVTTRTLEQNILESAGYRVLTAPDGAVAWELLQVEQCDLLVADVRMPEMDGIELTQRVRRDARLAQLPVVMVTSLDTAAERQRGIDAGADAYIVKSSFDEDALLSTIERLV